MGCFFHGPCIHLPTDPVQTTKESAASSPYKTKPGEAAYFNFYDLRKDGIIQKVRGTANCATGELVSVCPPPKKTGKSVENCPAHFARFLNIHYNIT